jgi:phage gpG-like protein
MYRIEVNLADLRHAITALENFPLTRRERILPGLGAVLAAGVARAFNDEVDPVSGAAWADLSPVTIARRAAAGHDGKKLDVTGGLRSSFAVDIDGDTVTVGANKIYATTMHFGAKRGAFGRTRRGGPIPWGDIPARPLLPVSGQGEMNAWDKEEIRDILANAVNGLFSA